MGSLRRLSDVRGTLEIIVQSETNYKITMTDNGKQQSNEVFQPAHKVASVSHCSSMEQYKTMHAQSLKDPELFWSNIAKGFHFDQGVQGKFLDYNFDVSKDPIYIKWMVGATTNMCYNCLDKHV